MKIHCRCSCIIITVRHCEHGLLAKFEDHKHLKINKQTNKQTQTKQNKTKQTRSISRHLGRKTLVNEGFIISIYCK